MGDGAIYTNLSSLILNNSKSVNNTAEYGGAIYSYTASRTMITIFKTTKDNNALKSGGAIYFFHTNAYY